MELKLKQYESTLIVYILLAELLFTHQCANYVGERLCKYANKKVVALHLLPKTERGLALIECSSKTMLALLKTTPIAYT